MRIGEYDDADGDNIPRTAHTVPLPLPLPLAVSVHAHLPLMLPLAFSLALALTLGGGSTPAPGVAPGSAAAAATAAGGWAPRGTGVASATGDCGMGERPGSRGMNPETRIAKSLNVC